MPSHLKFFFTRNAYALAGQQIKIETHMQIDNVFFRPWGEQMKSGLAWIRSSFSPSVPMRDLILHSCPKQKPCHESVHFRSRWPLWSRFKWGLKTFWALFGRNSSNFSPVVVHFCRVARCNFVIWGFCACKRIARKNKMSPHLKIFFWQHCCKESEAWKHFSLISSAELKKLLFLPKWCCFSSFCESKKKACVELEEGLGECLITRCVKQKFFRHHPPVWARPSTFFTSDWTNGVNFF